MEVSAWMDDFGFYGYLSKVCQSFVRPMTGAGGGGRGGTAGEEGGG